MRRCRFYANLKMRAVNGDARNGALKDNSHTTKQSNPAAAHTNRGQIASFRQSLGVYRCMDGRHFSEWQEPWRTFEKDIIYSGLTAGKLSYTEGQMTQTTTSTRTALTSHYLENDYCECLPTVYNDTWTNNRVGFFNWDLTAFH